MTRRFVALISFAGLAIATLVYCSTPADPVDAGNEGGAPDVASEGCFGKGCPCTDKTGACYEGPTGTASRGICKTGTHDCVNGVWGDCKGQVLPKVETCNGLDDDCNEKKDDMPLDADIIDTFEEAGVQCYTKFPGLCKYGRFECTPSEAGTPSCTEYVSVGSRGEECNNLDDDCNGQIDDGLENTGACDVDGGIGACGHGSGYCGDGGQPFCKAASPTTETCDGVDENCDGKLDNGSCEAGMPDCCKIVSFHICLELDASGAILEAGLITYCNLAYGN